MKVEDVCNDHNMTYTWKKYKGNFEVNEKGQLVRINQGIKKKKINWQLRGLLIQNGLYN